VFLRRRGRGKKKPDAPPRYRKDTINYLQPNTLIVLSAFNIIGLL